MGAKAQFAVDGITYTPSGSEVSVTGYGTKPTGALVIPATVTNNGTTYSVTSIGSAAFKSCTGLTSVAIPNSVTIIKNNAFESCSGIVTITFPNSITTIEKWAFSSCSALTSVTIPYSITTIGLFTFNGCSKLTTVNAENPNTSVGAGAFNNAASLYVPKCFEGNTWTNYTGQTPSSKKLTKTNRDAARTASLTLAAGHLQACYYHYPLVNPGCAYLGKLVNGNVVLTKIPSTTTTIPAGTPFIVCGPSDGNGVTLTESSTDSYTPITTDNDLKGSITATTGSVRPFGTTDNNYDFNSSTATAPEYTAFLTADQASTSAPVVVARTITASDYITLSYPFALDLTGKAEASSVPSISQNGALTTTPVTSGVLAANQPVLLYGSAAATSLPVSSLTNGEIVSGTNLLNATTGEAIGTDINAYILAKKNDVTAFYKLAAESENRVVAENRAYLVPPASGSSKAFFGIGKNTTAIDDVLQNAAEDNSAYYTLQGARVDNPTKGLYVKKGKVIIIK